ncbi:MAG: DmsC/YnfH family molybdoenzyme membrane anchor subunit [Holophaga sp.]
MAFQFTFDLNRCTGCQACVVGCWMENHAQQDLNWRQVHTFNGCRHPALPVFHLSLACHHCEDPACLKHCPANAYTKDAATGAVIIHAERCMGCRYCTWACPHDAPKFNAGLGTIEKCTFCFDRIGQGQEPACVARCPVEALGFEPSAPENRHHDIPGFPASTLNPSIRFQPLRRSVGPELCVVPKPALLASFLDQVLAVPERKITLRGEWSLVIFTSILAVLAGWFLAARMGGPAIPPLAFLGLGLLAMGLSAWHLGRRERAWRALLHLRSSWLSREIALVSSFLGLGGLYLVFFPHKHGLAWLAALVGFLGLLAVDRIYRVALTTGKPSLHSGQALLNGCYLLSILARLPFLFAGALALKTFLYVHRKWHFRRQGQPLRPWLSLTRLGLGFVLPAILWTWSPLLAALSAVLGDLVDRCEFYDELEVASPQGELAKAFKRGAALSVGTVE